MFQYFGQKATREATDLFALLTNRTTETLASIPMPRRMRILLSAYFCSPYKGSESGLGWNVATRLAKLHDVTVLCGDLRAEQPTWKDLVRYREERGLPDGLTIEHVPPDRMTKCLNRLHEIPGLWFAYYLAYRRWQQLAFKRAKQLHAKRPFDIAHHLNIIGYREPGYLWKLGIPFFWGPLTGAVCFPSDYLKKFTSRERLRWGMRNRMNRLQLRGSRRCRKAARKAVKIWAVTKDDLNMLRGRWRVDGELMLETGTHFDSNARHSAPTLAAPAAEPLRIVWSGLFLGIKALPILLHAMKKLPPGKFSLDVLGDGPEGPGWHELTSSLGLNDSVRFHGYLPKENAIEIMSHAHVLVHTSVKEGTPHVVLEALSLGLPVLCHDSCGMGVAVNETCGLLVPVENWSRSVDGFADGLARLRDEPGLLVKLSVGARNRAAELSWEHLIERIDEAYRINV